MTDSNEYPTLLAVAKSEGERAKTLWGIAFVAQILAILAGGLLPLLHKATYGEALLVASLGVVGSLIRWLSDLRRSATEKLFSKVEGEYQLGWPISRKTRLDAYQNADLKAARKVAAKPEDYWASTEPQGPRRCADCVRESAWWSEHLARGMGVLALTWAFLFLLGGFIALFGALREPTAPHTSTDVAKAIMSILSVAFTGGLLRLGFDYLTFSRNAADATTRADQLFDAAAVDQIDAVRTLHDYQVARSKAPPIPTWFHWFRKKKLNELWTRLGSQRTATEAHRK